MEILSVMRSHVVNNLLSWIVDILLGLIGGTGSLLTALASTRAGTRPRLGHGI